MKPNPRPIYWFAPLLALILFAINVYCASRLSIASVTIKNSESHITELSQEIDLLKASALTRMSISDLSNEAKRRQFMEPVQTILVQKDQPLAYYAP